ncbi:OadG family protein [Sulfurospirillum sp. T05]|uniref:Probable oxaloacetate decarboxylase gamma chain n=1 Tax=Sulfurospirillum tamanense TaxID=2813362 RepID=A0ABS2WPP8_9BACT|nr:OadG family protein [Sulfurospirillum tamanensis]MBN2963619.1 OadG family protein [Sulfurospirillum tamanensis]
MEINLVTEGLKFMVLGITTVFLFLVLMVAILYAQSAILTTFFPQKPTPKPQQTPGSTPSSPSDETTLVAVISAAIQTFRNQKRH